MDLKLLTTAGAVEISPLPSNEYSIARSSTTVLVSPFGSSQTGSRMPLQSAGCKFHAGATPRQAFALLWVARCGIKYGGRVGE